MSETPDISRRKLLDWIEAEHKALKDRPTTPALDNGSRLTLWALLHAMGRGVLNADS